MEAVGTDFTVYQPNIIELEVDGATVGSLRLPDTLGFNNFQWTGVSGILLPEGVHTLKLKFIGGFNFDAFNFGMSVVEAEDYGTGGSGTGYNDATTGNAGGSYRNDNVDIYACNSCSNGYTVGYTQTSEWLSYPIVVGADGKYEFNFTVGTEGATNQIKMLVDGVDVGTITLPNTGRYYVSDGKPAQYQYDGGEANGAARIYRRISDRQIQLRTYTNDSRS